MVSSLDLSHNDLTTLPEFCPLQHSLRNLHLKGNYISTIHSTYFVGYPLLQNLDISINSLVEVDGLRSLNMSLIRLRVDDNDILSLDDFFMSTNYTSLQRFNARRNNITHFHVSFFSHMPKLQFCYLGRNRIASIGDFRKVYQGQIFIKNNPWYCGRKISWMLDANTSVMNQHKCQAPPCLRGKSISNLSKSLMILTSLLIMQILWTLNTRAVKFRGRSRDILKHVVWSP